MRFPAILKARKTKMLALLIVANEIRGLAVVGAIVWAWFKSKGMM